MTKSTRKTKRDRGTTSHGDSKLCEHKKRKNGIEVVNSPNQAFMYFFYAHYAFPSSELFLFLVRLLIIVKGVMMALQSRGLKREE